MTIQDNTRKTSISLDKHLLEEIDRLNPFPTRKAFFQQACRDYLEDLKRRTVYRKLADACAESAAEDTAENRQWEDATLENWA